MTGTIISALPAATSLTGDETIPVVQGGITKSALLSQIPNGSGSGETGIANGGTGASTPAAALNNLLPTQAGHPGEVLSTDGAGNVTWQPSGGSTASAVQWLADIADVASGGASGTLALLNIAGGLPNDGDAILVEFYGVASDGGGGNLSIGVEVNGQPSGRIAILSDPTLGFTFHFYFKRAGAFISYTGWGQLAVDQSIGPDPNDPAHVPHMSPFQDSCPVGGNFTVDLAFTWSAPVGSSIEVVGGYAQLMKTPPLS